MEDDYRRRYSRPEEDSGVSRFGEWLKQRPAESWIFFAAGIFLGGLFF